jgi:hypothetical protein
MLILMPLRFPKARMAGQPITARQRLAPRRVGRKVAAVAVAEVSFLVEPVRLLVGRMKKMPVS